MKNIDRDENKIAIMLPFVTGVGPGEMETILNMFSLPNSKHYERTIFRWQPSTCDAIIEISDREMQYAMEEEIRATIIADKGEAYFESWINKPLGERDKVGLVVSYDMGWQKRASGNSYSSKSGHAFVVGMQTKRIIDCVVFSTNCKKCESKPMKKKKKEEEGRVDSEPTEEDCQVEEDKEDDDAPLWSSSFIRPTSTLADDGAVAESTTQSEPKPAPTKKGNITVPVVTSCRRTFILPPPPTVSPTANSPSVCSHKDCVSCPRSPPSVSYPVLYCTPTKDEVHQPRYTRATHQLEQGQIIGPEHMSTNLLEPSKDHSCPCNYDGSPGSMESDGMLWLIKRLYTMMEGKTFMSTLSVMMIRP